MTSLAYEKHKATNRRQMAEKSRTGRDVGALPWVANPARRLATSRDFRLYCDSYFPQTFHLDWSDDHLTVIGQIEESVLRGGLFATAMPRGSGKTSIVEVAGSFAILHGHHPFACLIGSDEGHAEQMLDSIKTELELNELLAEDFPEVCTLIAALDGIANRCSGQLYDGERTHIEWTAKEIVLPTIKPAGWPDRDDHRPFVRPNGYSLSSGAIIKVAGLTGGIRGMKHKRADGQTVRPTLVIPDDPQTDQSAASPSQCATRERILAGAVLGLAGPGKKIAGIMPCTVIRSGDMADRILNRDLHPDWNGTRTKMVYAFPANEKLWEEYGRIRADGLRAGDAGRAATEFYRENRDAMDAGSRVAWPARFNHDELSAVQNAMNLKLRDERAFFAEYQNEPLPEQESRGDDLTHDQIAGKVNRLKRGTVPLNCNRLTAFIDVQASLLFYLVAAWEDDFTGYVLDYGAFPDQKRPYFTLRDAKTTLATLTPGAGLEGQIFAGLEALTASLLGREWARDDGAMLKVERCLIDANWGSSTDTIYQFCRQSSFASAVMPSHGKYVGASSCPMREYATRPGERVGLNWRLPNVAGRRATRYCVYDTNFWKTFAHARLATAMGDRGCLSLYGDRPDAHRMLADHLTSEYRVRTEGRGRQVDEWRLRPERPDNHWLDCLAGAAVAASMQGVALAESGGPPSAGGPRKRVSFADLKNRKRA